MCIIQANFFIKNGVNQPGPSCNGYSTNKIETDTIVSFASSEVGKTVKIGVKIRYPDGIERQRWSPTFVVPSAGAFDFVIPLDLNIAGLGNYSIIGAEVWNYTTSVLMCSGNPSGGFCQSLLISAPPCPALGAAITIAS